MTRIASFQLLSTQFDGAIRHAQGENTFHARNAVSDENLKFHAWQLAFHDLIRERDREKINVLAPNVQRLIFERFQQLDNESDSETERQALKEALTVVRILMGDQLEDWEENWSRKLKPSNSACIESEPVCHRTGHGRMRGRVGPNEIETSLPSQTNGGGAS